MKVELFIVHVILFVLENNYLKRYVVHLNYFVLGVSQISTVKIVIFFLEVIPHLWKNLYKN